MRMSTTKKNGNSNVFERLYQNSRNKKQSQVMCGDTSKRSESRVSTNSHNNRTSLLDQSS